MSTEFIKIFCCITFHYKIERIKYLFDTLLGVSEIKTEKTRICIITNTSIRNELQKIKDIIEVLNTDRIEISIEIFDSLINPWFLTWAHKSLMATHYLRNEYSHFLYLEDDIRVSNSNITYWLEYRETLKLKNLYPSFLRVEVALKSNEWMSTDITRTISLNESNFFYSEDHEVIFVNSPQPYQGMFFYDNELMKEHLLSVTANAKDYGLLEFVDSNPNWPGGGVAERANFALTYHNVPDGYTSRNVLAFQKYYLLIDNRCLVHHTPNNYANNKSDSCFGKIKVCNLLTK
jgi:hypothetical protein